MRGASETTSAISPHVRMPNQQSLRVGHAPGLTLMLKAFSLLVRGSKSM